MEAAEAGVAAQRPEGFGADLHIGVASVEPGTGALRGFYGGQDYLDSSSTGRARAGRRLDDEGVRDGRGHRAGLLAQRHLRGQLAPRALPDGSEIGNQGDTDYGSAITMLTAVREPVNTAFIDMTER